MKTSSIVKWFTRLRDAPNVLVLNPVGTIECFGRHRKLITLLPVKKMIKQIQKYACLMPKEGLREFTKNLKKSIFFLI